MDEKKGELRGVEFNKNEMFALVEMFHSKGYKQYLRIFEAIKNDEIEATLGNPLAYQLATFLHSQGAYVLINQLEDLPVEAESAFEKLEEKLKEKKVENLT